MTTSNTVVSQATDPPPFPGSRRWIALAVILIGTFVAILDFLIVNVAIPSIQHDLRASFADVELVVAGYGLAYAVGLITGGRLGDIHGHKLMFIVGMIGFISTSVLCSLATSSTMLIISRIFQGLSAAILYPQVMAIIQVSFVGKERTLAFGLLGAVIGMAMVSGQLIGGLLIHADIFGLTWRPTFLVNVPIGLIAIIAVIPLVQESRSLKVGQLDIVGVIIVSFGLSLAVFPLIEGREQGWPWWVYASMLLSIPVFIGFTFYEKHLNSQGGTPLIDLSLFTNRSFINGLLIVLTFFQGPPSFLLVFAYYLQIGLSLNAITAGLTIVPYSLGFFAASLLSVRLASKLGRSILSIGTLIMSVGLLFLIATILYYNATLLGVELIPSLLIIGIGHGLIMTPLFKTVLVGVSHSDAGSASGMLSTVQQVAQAIGVAVIGTIFFSLLGVHADSISNSITPQIHVQLIKIGVPAVAVTELVTDFRYCFHDRTLGNEPFLSPASCTRITTFQLSVKKNNTSNTIVKHILTSALAQAQASNYTYALSRALIYNIILLIATAGFVSLLPKQIKLAERNFIDSTEDEVMLHP